MPRVATYRLAWSASEQTYLLQQTREHTLLHIRPDTPAWFGWLKQVSSFAFVGRSGHCTARKESRAHLGAYWYAYRGADRQLRKKYLGKSVDLTIARLEKLAAQLATQAPELPGTGLAPGPPEHFVSPLIEAADSRARPARQTSTVPVPLSPLLGREREVAAALTLLGQPEIRLLTLTGTGGVGKTRLALAIATEVRRAFSDGIYFISLASIRDPALVLPTIMQALDLHDSGTRTPLELLQAALRGQRPLLVLDNFEQVVEATPHLVELLTACPHITMLVTSREVLHVRGEHELPVLPLAWPDPRHLPDLEALVRYGAVALFLERAREVLPSFELTQVTASHIVEICRRLDGLPLALELAAARLKLLPLAALLERLEHRLVVLTAGSRDLPERQHTLRATIAWSYDLLSQEERRLFRRLSVFVGGCTLEAIEAVDGALGDETAQLLDAVTSLLDKHLLSRADQDATNPRFQMLETIREYGLEALEASGELEAVRLSHARYYLAKLKEVSTHILAREEQRWVDQLVLEYDNVRAVLFWSLEQIEDRQRRDIAWRLAGSLSLFWVAHGHVREGQRFVERALEKEDGISESVQAKAFNSAGWLALWHGEYGRADVLCRKSLQLHRRLHDRRGMGDALYRLGWIASTRDDYRQATALFEESLILVRDVGDKIRIAFSLAALALTTLGLADRSTYPRVRSLLEESLALFRQERYETGIPWSLYGLGLWHFRLDDSTTARSLFVESLELFRELRAPLYTSYALYQLGRVAARQGDLPAASMFYQESLAMFQELDNQRSVAVCLEGWAGVVARQGYPAWATQLWGTAEVLRATVSPSDLFSLPATSEEQADQKRIRARVRAELGEKVFAQALCEGHAMTPEQVLAEAKRHAPASQTRPSPSVAGDLTRREIEVLHLLTEGRSDAQIAEVLVISPRTVNAHLRSIYSKLGVTSRHAATHYATVHRLV